MHDINKHCTELYFNISISSRLAEMEKRKLIDLISCRVQLQIDINSDHVSRIQRAISLEKHEQTVGDEYISLLVSNVVRCNTEQQKESILTPHQQMETTHGHGLQELNKKMQTLYMIISRVR